MPQPLAEHERVAAEYNGDVVVPAAKGTAFVVVEPKLALQVFVHSLGTPALLRDPHELLSAWRLAQTRKCVVRRCLLRFGPLDQEPVGAAISVARIHLEHGEPRPEGATAPLLPRRGTEGAA